MAVDLTQTPPSTFGLDESTLGPEFRALAIINSERARVLDRKQSYYSCTQHDWKQYDFDGRPIPMGNPLMGQPSLASQPSDWYVPLRMRRPVAPYRLARTITDSFTNLVFGYQRWPTIRCSDDPDTESFARGLVDAIGLRALMIRARTLGGCTGSVCLSWCFFEGRPIVQVHNPKSIYVHAWADRDLFIPAHVIEITKFARDEFDPKTKKFERRWYWFRRDWTMHADVAFHEIPFIDNADPRWLIDEANTHIHGDGFCHFVFGQNLPNENGEEFDGVADYEGLYEMFDSLDLLYSTLVRGTTLNLDPTVILKLDPDLVARQGVKKGTDNALMVGESGDARYMELQGTSVQAGTSLFAKMRESALEAAQCVAPDPNVIGAAGTSSVALKIVYAPMLSKADILREQYERVVQILILQMIRSARMLNDTVVIEFADDGSERETASEEYVLDLPMQYVTVEDVDPETGELTGTTHIETRELRPGRSSNLVFDWGDYFTPTAQDQQQLATTLGQAVVAGLVSEESGADLMARSLRIDPRADWERIQREKKTKAEQQAAAFQDDGFAGGRVGDMNELPPGAARRGAAKGPGADVVTVDEARAMMGLPPLGTADGSLTLAEFQARQRAKERIAVEDVRAGHESARAARERAQDAQDAQEPPGGGLPPTPGPETPSSPVLEPGTPIPRPDAET